MHVCFTVPIEPFGKGRPRFTAANGRRLAYTPAKTRHGEAIIKKFASMAMEGRDPFPEGVPLRVRAKLFFSIPKSYTKKRHEACLVGKELPTKKPDCDNAIKACLDPMNGVVFHDDNQVVLLELQKYYSQESGRIEIEVSPVLGTDKR